MLLLVLTGKGIMIPTCATQISTYEAAFTFLYVFAYQL